MHEWSLALNQIPIPVLAADGALDSADYTDDQIWEISSHQGEPLALTLQTTYGLRARSMRIFPIFISKNETVVDPASFYKQPLLCQFYPNYLRFTYSPFSGIDVQSEYWVSSSQGIGCRTSIINQTSEDASLRVEWAVLLSPLTDGHGMTQARHERTPILCGATANLMPVFLLSGNATNRNGPFPALSLDLNLPPAKLTRHTWALASLADSEVSYISATQMLSKNWEAEIARIEMFNANRLIEIESGHPEWDAAFAFSQVRAFGLIFNKDSVTHLPTFVRNRLPDQGFSHKGDGSDYDPLWKQERALDTWYLASLILPGSSETIQNSIRILLKLPSLGDNAQDSSHFSLLPAPILSTLVLKIFDLTGDHAFLEEVFPSLVTLVNHWFDPINDRDQDGFPEWNRPSQTGFEENPLFSPWEASSPAYAIDTFESPALGVLLIREMDTLFTIARLINQVSAVLPLLPKLNALRQNIESTWEARSCSYHYRDRDSHTCLRGKRLAQVKGPGIHPIEKSFPKPRRLQIRITSTEDLHRTASLHLWGSASAGPVQEELSFSPFQWTYNRISATTQQTFLSLEKIEVTGLSPKDRLSIDLVDYSQVDITSLTPIWAGVPNPRRIENLVRKTILNPQLFYAPFGLATHVNGSMGDKILLPWNQMVIEGLFHQGYVKEAIDIFTHLMKAISSASTNGGSYSHYYHAHTAEGSGERNDLLGFPPLGLFLDLLGVQFLTSQEVILSGFNPFSEPVTVKYHGIKVTRSEETTRVTFPDGQVTLVKGKERQRISLG